MRVYSALCWSLLLLVALLSQNVTAKGGRGGARGGARGASRGTSRVRAKMPTRYGSFRVSAAAAAGAAVGASAGLTGKRWRSDDGSEVDTQWRNNTSEGIYGYRAWTSGTDCSSKPLLFGLVFCITTIFKVNF
ncbi:hypothetical protein GDO86_013045 [Hymenochirus boettgeri]|uniref:Shadow of prion protein n=1 Tax=Hymenochirus boettgeri TaxID=247094 RepID=A0A8T2IV56_9PIPI|nr:hypothetical protein GDO86_013045 [Hymenochirus boettgeri]